MELMTGIKEWFFGVGRTSYYKSPFYNYCEADVLEGAFLDYALNLCINRIAYAFTMTEFNTYEKGKDLAGNRAIVKTRKDLFYRLNIAPNINQTAFEFYRKLIYQAVFNPEGAVVAEIDGTWVIADGVDVVKFATKPNVYKNFVVDNYTFDKVVFLEKDVLRLNLNSANIKPIVERVYSFYSEMITGAMKKFNRENAEKLFIKIDTNFPQMRQVEVQNEDGSVTTMEIDVLSQFFSETLKNHFSTKDSATPMEDGLEILRNENGKGYSSVKNGDTKDFDSLFIGILKLVCNAFNLAPGFVLGETADAEVMTDNSIAFGINPVVKAWQDELNRKLYPISKFLDGSRIIADTTRVKTTDPVKSAPSYEALLRIGVVNNNTVRGYISQPEILEPWAEQYYVTKNYESIQGGNNSEQTQTKSETRGSN